MTNSRYILRLRDSNNNIIDELLLPDVNEKIVKEGINYIDNSKNYLDDFCQDWEYDTEMMCGSFKDTVRWERLNFEVDSIKSLI